MSSKCAVTHQDITVWSQVSVFQLWGQILFTEQSQNPHLVLKIFDGIWFCFRWIWLSSDSRPVVWMWHHCKYLCIIGWFYDQSGSLVTCFCLFTLNKNLWIERKNRSEVWIKQFLSLHHVLNFLWSCITHNSLCSNSPNKLKIDFTWVILLCNIVTYYVTFM